MHSSAFVSLQDVYLNDRIAQLAVVSDIPTLKRPYAVAQVRQYVNAIKTRIPGLYQEIDRGLRRYESTMTLTRANVSVAKEFKSASTLPQINQQAEPLDSHYRVTAQSIITHDDWLVLSVGGVARDATEKLLPVDSYIVFGGNNIALDFGFREHWLSNFHNGAMLYSNNARPSLSLGLSNPLAYENWWDLKYELFATQLETQQNIATGSSLQNGRPIVAGTHLSFSPLDGWVVGLTRTLQFGGGDRPRDFSTFWDAFFDPNNNDNDYGDLCSIEQPNCEFGNQQAALSSRINFSGETPFSLYCEYAGEDASTGGNKKLGNLAVSYGLYIPFLPPFIGQDWSFRFELQQWQNAWYAHHIYGDGYTNDLVVLGHWGGDQRVFNDAVGATSHYIAWGKQLGERERIEWQWRQLKNEDYGIINYSIAKQLRLDYLTERWGQHWLLSLQLGNDVFNQRFARIELGWNY